MLNFCFLPSRSYLDPFQQIGIKWLQLPLQHHILWHTSKPLIIFAPNRIALSIPFFFTVCCHHLPSCLKLVSSELSFVLFSPSTHNTLIQDRVSRQSKFSPGLKLYQPLVVLDSWNFSPFFICTIFTTRPSASTSPLSFLRDLSYTVPIWR